MGIFVFGVLCYLFGVSALMGIIFSTLGFLPFSEGPILYEGTVIPVLVSAFLVSLFAIQHTIMARPRFKKWLANYFPAAGERALFVFATGLVTWTILIFWPPLKQQVWDISGTTIGTALWFVGVAGWAYLFIASFALNHFELFGLQQVFYKMKSKVMPEVAFSENWMYKFDRHPIMTGALIGFWAIPSMTLDHFLFASFFSLYVMVGVKFEEHDLIAELGDKYLEYKSRVGTVVPFLPNK